MVIVIGSNAQKLCRALEGTGIHTAAYQADRIPSLTSLVLSTEGISDIVMLQGEEKNWSMGHILAAAKQLHGKGYIYFLSPSNKPPALIHVAKDPKELLQLLQAKPTKGTAGSSGGTQKTSSKADIPTTVPKADVKPLTIPPGKILFLGVVGSQHRIGCTTQAVGLWHYCKALGFDAAIVASREQIVQIAGPMKCQEIQSGYKIEGIPFVADTALQYDCYILDIGPGSIQDALQATDCLVLVAGSKPWELQNTATALKAAKGKDMLVLLSFSSETDMNGLKPLFGRQSVAVPPWMPELWQPSADALTVYDILLRPALEKILSREVQQADEEFQLLRGE